MEDFTRDDISTTRTVSYRLNGGFPKWTVHRPGSYAKGFEHMADELMTVERVVFHFAMSVGQWVLHEIVLSLRPVDDNGPKRSVYHERITGQSTLKMPFWLVKLTASAAQEG